MTTSIKVVSLKGQQISSLEVSLDTTIKDLKYHISRRMNGQQVAHMKLIHCAKPLSDEDRSLRSYGFKPGHNNVHLVSRFNGGAARNAVQEVAVQLRYVKRGRLHGVELVEPEDDMTWNLLMRSSGASPYKGAMFCLAIKFPSNYPYSPPEVKFNTPIFHPNVFKSGMLCWHENDTTGSVYYADILIGAINTLLESPNPDSPANSEAANLYVNNRSEYNRRVKAFCEQHALA